MYPFAPMPWGGYQAPPAAWQSPWAYGQAGQPMATGYAPWPGYGYYGGYSNSYYPYSYGSNYYASGYGSSGCYPTGQTYEPGDGYSYPVYYCPSTGGYIYYPVR